VYVGDLGGRQHLEAAGVPVAALERDPLSANQVLVVGPGGASALTNRAAAMADWLKAGGHLLALGLNQNESSALLPIPVAIKNAEHIAAFFDPPSRDSPLAGIGPADVHSRDPRELPLIDSGLEVVGNGVLGRARDMNVVLCQLAPWQFDPAKPMNLKRTHRRASFLVTRLLANLGVAGSTPLLDRFHHPPGPAEPEKRWLSGFYLDQPEAWDDPYRFFRW
jgi:hypothetical protein